MEEMEVRNDGVASPILSDVSSGYQLFCERFFGTDL